MPRPSQTSTRSVPVRELLRQGINDLDAMTAAMADRFPENARLSQDQFEGPFARAGLMTDVELL